MTKVERQKRGRVDDARHHRTTSPLFVSFHLTLSTKQAAQDEEWGNVRGKKRWRMWDGGWGGWGESDHVSLPNISVFPTQVKPESMKEPVKEYFALFHQSVSYRSPKSLISFPFFCNKSFTGKRIQCMNASGSLRRKNWGHFFVTKLLQHCFCD